MTPTTQVPAAWRVARSRTKERVRAFRRTPEYAVFLDAFRTFVEDDVVRRVVGEDVAFQIPPTLRVHAPGRRPLGKKHKDADYPGHQGDEINFWCPLTSVSGSNSLFVESMPGRGDFRALDLQPGHLFRFDGEHCEHYTLANQTSCTRVSLDFRVIPLSVWRNDFGDRIGAYPCETTRVFSCDGEKSREADEQKDTTNDGVAESQA